MDDQPFVREGLMARISGHPDLEVCRGAADPEEALALIGVERPDLAIVNLALRHGGGLDLIRRLAATDSAPSILVIGAYEQDLFAERALRAGAQGYLNEQELHGSVIDAIRTVLGGGVYLSAAMAHRIANPAIPGRGSARGIEALSDREMQVFDLIGRGQGTRATAERLHLSVLTVELHHEIIRTKLGLRSGAELLRHAGSWTLRGG